MYFNNAYTANPAWRYGPATRQGVPLLAISAGGDAAECRAALGRMSQKERAASVARALEEVHHSDVAAVREAAKTVHDTWWALYVTHKLYDNRLLGGGAGGSGRQSTAGGR